MVISEGPNNLAPEAKEAKTVQTFDVLIKASLEKADDLPADAQPVQAESSGIPKAMTT